MTVLGLGIEGIDLVHYLASEGARVTVSDNRDRADLRDALDAIAEADPALSLGGHDPEAIFGADAVFVSQGVPWHLPTLDEARTRGIEVSSMTRLFFERCPAPIAGITGSSGKTTTTALTAAMLEASGANYVVGGNIGVGLLGLLERIDAETKVVAEISHTQLQSVDASPRYACLTNVTPNHLDRFSWDEYVDLKRRIYAFQGPEDVAIFNADDPVSRGLALEAPGGVEHFSLEDAIAGDGAALEGDSVVRYRDGTATRVLGRDEIRLRGAHNVANVLAAVALASRLGVPDEAMAEAVRQFSGVPHRLEPVASVGGVSYVNDSIATTPERTLAGMRAFEERLVLLLGGRDKQLPLADLGAEARARCRAVVTFGEASELYASAVRAERDGPEVQQVADVASAVGAAARLAKPGDVVLFSPAGTSFDAYPNFERRGEAFRAAVASLSGRAGLAGRASEVGR